MGEPARDFKLKMLNGIAAVTLTISDIQANYKLSQNRALPEQQKIKTTLANSGNELERKLAEYMQQER